MIIFTILGPPFYFETNGMLASFRLLNTKKNILPAMGVLKVANQSHTLPTQCPLQVPFPFSSQTNIRESFCFRQSETMREYRIILRSGPICKLAEQRIPQHPVFGTEIMRTLSVNYSIYNEKYHLGDINVSNLDVLECYYANCQHETRHQRPLVSC